LCLLHKGALASFAHMPVMPGAGCLGVPWMKRLAFAVRVTTALGQSHALDLGTAATFTILSKAGITNVPTSVITGDIGVSPIAAGAMTGFDLVADGSNALSTSTQVDGRVYAASYAAPTAAMLTVAILDMEAAYDDAASRVSPPENTDRKGSSPWNQASRAGSPLCYTSVAPCRW